MKDKYKEVLLKHFKPKEVDKIMSGLKQLSFFTLPASTKYHCAIKGGLAKHSMNVYEKSVELLPVLGNKISEKDVKIVSLFHDLNKCLKGYQPNVLKSGQISPVNPYKSDAILTGDGSLSCHLIVTGKQL